MRTWAEVSPARMSGAAFCPNTADAGLPSNRSTRVITKKILFLSMGCLLHTFFSASGFHEFLHFVDLVFYLHGLFDAGNLMDHFFCELALQGGLRLRFLFLFLLCIAGALFPPVPEFPDRPTKTLADIRNSLGAEQDKHNDSNDDQFRGSKTKHKQDSFENA